MSHRWRRRTGAGGEGIDNQLEGREEGGGGGGRATCSTTSSVGDNGGPAATTLLDPPTPFVVAAAAINGEAPVPLPDQIAGVDVTILMTRLWIRRERGRQDWQM